MRMGSLTFINDIIQIVPAEWNLATFRMFLSTKLQRNAMNLVKKKLYLQVFDPKYTVNTTKEI